MLKDATVVLVVGMHRTGTSLAMGALESLGVDPGRHLLPPGPDNETGYWEDESILDLNVRLMAALGMSWSSVGPMSEADWAKESVATLRGEAVALLNKRFADSRLCGFKDPRCIRVLPFWQLVLADLDVAVKYVVTFRNPESVAASLAYRNHFPRGKSYFLWLSHYVPYLDRLLNERCLFVNYDRFMDEPRRTMDRLHHFVRGDEPGCGPDSGRSVAAFLGTTLQERLRHTRVQADQLEAGAPRVLKDTFALLEDILREGNLAGVHRRVETLQRQYCEYALLLRQVDETETVASKLRNHAREEEPVRDKIEKLGLYLKDAEEKVSSRIGQLHHKLGLETELLAVLEDRVEDVQEKVVVQIDELHRALGLKAVTLGEVDDKVAAVHDAVEAQGQTLNRLAERMGDLQQAIGRELEATRNDARAQLDRIYRSTSWRITRPVRAVKILARKFLASFHR